MRSLALLFCFLFGFQTNLFSSEKNCEIILNEVNQSATLDLLSLLDFLVNEKRVMTIEQYENFLLSVVKGHPENPFTEKEKSTTAVKYTFSKLLQKYIDQWAKDSNYIDQGLFVDMANRVLSDFGRKTIEKQALALDTKNPFVTFKFHSMFEENDVEIFFMSTLVTQWMWSNVMGDNPSRFNKGIDSTSVQINGKFIQMRPDHPVEIVTWEDAQEFIKRIHLMDENDDPLLRKLIEDHKKGDRYRLIKEKEYRYLTALSSHSRENLRDYAWYRSNSSMETQSVASLHAHLLNGHEFYDLTGNVKIWGEETYQGISTAHDYLKMVFGGSYLEDLIFIMPADSAYQKNYQRLNFCASDIGLRLVRERKISK